MAKLMIEVDTESKQMSVSIDGVTHDNVDYICVNKYKSTEYGEEGEDELHFAVEKSKKENGVKTRETVMASKKTSNSIKNYLKSLKM